MLKPICETCTVGNGTRRTKAATAYVRRIQQFVRSLDVPSERGSGRDDIYPGLRLIPFGSVVLAARVEDTKIIVFRVFYGGQDWAGALQRQKEKPPSD